MDVARPPVAMGSGTSRVQVTVLSQCAVLSRTVCGMAAFNLHVSISQLLHTIFLSSREQVSAMRRPLCCRCMLQFRCRWVHGRNRFIATLYVLTLSYEFHMRPTFPVLRVACTSGLCDLGLQYFQSFFVTYHTVLSSSDHSNRIHCFIGFAATNR
jgi:hypothetical protein